MDKIYIPIRIWSSKCERFIRVFHFHSSVPRHPCWRSADTLWTVHEFDLRLAFVSLAARTRRYRSSTCRDWRQRQWQCLKYLAQRRVQKITSDNNRLREHYRERFLDRRACFWNRSVPARSRILTLPDVTDQTYAHAVRAILSREDLRFPAVRFQRTIYGGKRTKHTEPVHGL